MIEPPYNLDAERAVIACMFINNATFPTIRKIIGDHAFYVESHQLIWDAGCFLHDSGKKPDIIPVSERLTSTRNLERAGGLAYLSELLTCLPTSHNATEYATVVADLHRSRRILDLTGRLERDAASGVDVRGIAREIADIAESNRSQQIALVSLDDWLEEAMEPLDWLIKDWLLRGTVTVLAADGGTGKSFLSLGIVIETITGCEIWPGLKPSSRDTAILLDLENDRKSTFKRIRAYKEHYKIDHEYMNTCMLERLRFVNTRGSWLEQHGREYRASPMYLNFLEYCTNTKPAVIVIDHLRRISGSAEGNDNSVMGLLMELCDRLATASGAAVLILAHTNKASNDRGASAGNLRGASAIRDEARCVWELRREEGERLTLTRTKANHSSSMTAPLCFRMAPAADCACLELAPQESGGTDDVISLVMNFIGRNNCEVSLGAVRRRQGAKANALLNFVKADHPNITPGELYFAIQRAVDAGRLVITKGKDSTRHYREDLISLPTASVATTQADCELDFNQPAYAEDETPF